MNDELEKQEESEKYGEKALELYQKLYETTPKFEFKNRIHELAINNEE